MSGTPLRYATLVEKPEQLNVAAIAEALGVWRGAPAADMVLPARASWGVVADDVEQARAEALVDLLRARGISALAVPAGLLEEPPPALPAPALDFGLAKRLTLLAATAFKRTTTKTIKTMEGPSTAQKAVKIGLLIAGIPTGFGGGQREVVKQVAESDLFYYADLVLKDPSEKLRVDAQAFDYSCLGARKTYGASVNFRTLLELLSDAAPSAALNRGCRYLLAGKPVRETGYEGLEDLEREEKWLLTLRALGKI